MKKFLAWVMVLTMVLTMMPVMDEHNHAHAEITTKYGKCTKCTACTGYVETGSGFMKKCGTCASNCSGMGYKTRHELVVECDHDGTSTYTPYDALNHNRVCKGMAGTSSCPEYGVAVEEPHVWGDDTVCDLCEYNAHTCTFEITNCTESVQCAGGCGKWSTAMTAHSFAISDCTKAVTCGNDGCTVQSTPTDHSFPTITDCEVPVKCGKCTVWTTAADHVFDDDCTTNDQCDNCTVYPGASGGHMAESLQTNCLVAVKCAFCEQIAIEAKAAHTPEADDGDCTTPVECAKCDEIATPAKAAHTPKADDGDCTTPIVCEDCNTVTTPAKDHDWSNGTGLCADCGTACEHTGETYTETTKAATCKKEGTANVICDTCDVVIGTETLPVDTEDGHDWIVYSFGGWFCVHCGYITVDNPTDEPDPTPGQPSVTCPDNDHDWTKFSFGGWFCNKCGLKATDMGPLDPELCNHADTYQVIVKAATCKTAGTAQEICDICETVVNENVELPVDENAHDWIVFSFGAGYCKLCNKISADDSLFHDHEKEEEVCEHDWVEFSFGGWVCTKCGEITVNEEDTLPPEEPSNSCPYGEHEWTVFSFGGWVCNKCGYITLDNPTDEPDPVPVLPQPSNPCLVHEWTEFAFGGWVCSKCGAMTIEEPCYHENVEREIVNPTCVADGYAKDVCQDCGATVSEVVTLPLVPTAHKWEKGVCLNGCDTKCEHPAWSDCICDVCGYECGHDDVTVEVITAATCKEEGTGKETCNVCGNIEDVILPVDTKDGHDWIVFSFGGWFCTICGEATVDNPTDEPDPTPSLPQPSNPCPDDEHDWIVFSFGGWVCSKCGMMTIDNPTEDPDPTPVLPEPSNPCEDDMHDWVEFSFGGWVCSKCGMMTTEEPCEHTIVVDAAVAATCTETGLTEGKHCSVCGKVLTAQEVVAATGHDTELQTVTAATCKKEGTANEVCKVCGTIVNTVVLPVDTEDGHDWIVFSFGGWFCTICGEVTVDNPTDEPDPTPSLPQPSNPCPDGEHEWIVYSFGGWVCKKCGMMTIDNPTEDPDPTPVLPEPSNPCDEHDWIEFGFGGWVCSKCGMMTTEEPCKHEWENGVCSICGVECKHVSCTNGVCDSCGRMKGDVNYDGMISNIDVLMALQMKGVSVTWAADMNDNGVITNADVLAILQLK